MVAGVRRRDCRGLVWGFVALRNGAERRVGERQGPGGKQEGFLKTTIAGLPRARSRSVRSACHWQLPPVATRELPPGRNCSTSFDGTRRRRWSLFGSGSGFVLLPHSPHPETAVPRNGGTQHPSRWAAAEPRAVAAAAPAAVGGRCQTRAHTGPAAASSPTCSQWC